MDSSTLQVGSLVERDVCAELCAGISLSRPRAPAAPTLFARRSCYDAGFCGSTVTASGRQASGKSRSSASTLGMSWMAI